MADAEEGADDVRAFAWRVAMGRGDEGFHAGGPLFDDEVGGAEEAQCVTVEDAATRVAATEGEREVFVAGRRSESVDRAARPGRDHACEGLGTGLGSGREVPGVLGDGERSCDARGRRARGLAKEVNEALHTLIVGN